MALSHDKSKLLASPRETVAQPLLSSTENNILEIPNTMFIPNLQEEKAVVRNISPEALRELESAYNVYRRNLGELDKKSNPEYSYTKNLHNRYRSFFATLNPERTQFVSQESDVYLKQYEEECLEESLIAPSTKEYFWNAQAMGWGTAGWMGVYYLKDYFQFAKYVGYSLHSLLMGSIANLVALPFVYKGQRTLGESISESKKTMWKYFWLCLFPDSLYEPLADLFIALTNAESMHEVKFEKYADPQFNPKEIAASFAFFGVFFGLAYYAIKKKFFKEECSEEENYVEANTQFLKFLRGLRNIFEGPAGEAIKVSLQYVTFYFDDYLFDTDLGNGSLTFRNLFFACAVMGGFSFISDYFFKKIANLISVCEKNVYDNQLIQLDDNSFIRRKDFIPLEDDYIHIEIEEKVSQPETTTILNSNYGSISPTLFRPENSINSQPSTPVRSLKSLL